MIPNKITILATSFAGAVFSVFAEITGHPDWSSLANLGGAVVNAGLLWWIVTKGGPEMLKNFHDALAQQREHDRHELEAQREHDSRTREMARNEIKDELRNGFRRLERVFVAVAQRRKSDSDVADLATESSDHEQQR